MFTQPKDPNNKNKLEYKKYCSYCHRTNHSISACFKKQRDDEDKRDAYARSKSPYFVLLQMLEHKTMITDIEIELLHETSLTTKLIHKTEIVLNLEIDLAMTKVLPLHNTLDHDMTLTNVIHGLTVLHIDLRIDHPIDTTLVIDIDHVPIQETITFLNTQIHIDHLLDREILDILDPVHTPILERK